jgi:cytoskeletal protein RodZ
MDESIGAKLRQAREQRRLTLQQVSETTKVRPHYLQALENDDLSAISSAAQARGFLRIYAEFLGLGPADLMPARAPAQPELTQQLSISSSDQPLTSEVQGVSKNKPERSGFLANLLNRFAHRTSEETAEFLAPEPAPEVEIPPAPAEKPFVPARATEEISAVPASPVEDPKSEAQPIPTVVTPAIDSTPTVKVAKKTGSRPRKSATRVDGQSEVKKKVND